MPREKRYRWRRRVIGIVVAPAVVLACLSRPAILEDTWADVGVDLVAWLALATGAALRLWSTMYIGGRKSETVIAEGPYSLCRNPLYVGTFLLGLSLGLFLKSLTVVAAVSVGMLVYASATIPAEERFLNERFGDAYRAYCAKAPRFMPGLGRFHASETVEVNLRALRKELKAAVGWIAIPFLTEVVVHGRQQAWWPTLLRLP
ncbi:MAG TPA: isoprenylcysteine carboxylmethyltransferase family protein [Phycisphaerae bacterium]